MNRRGFLKAAACLPAAPFLKNPLSAAVSGLITKIAIPTLEQAVIDSAAVASKTGIVTTGNFAKVLWPGVAKWYSDVYPNISNEVI